MEEREIVNLQMNKYKICLINQKYNQLNNQNIYICLLNIHLLVIINQMKDFTTYKFIFVLLINKIKIYYYKTKIINSFQRINMFKYK